MVKYRARGTHKKTNREAWVTTVWRTNYKDAEDDKRMFGHHYKKGSIKIKKK